MLGYDRSSLGRFVGHLDAVLQDQEIQHTLGKTGRARREDQIKARARRPRSSWGGTSSQIFFSVSIQGRVRSRGGSSARAARPFSQEGRLGTMSLWRDPVPLCAYAIKPTSSVSVGCLATPTIEEHPSYTSCGRSTQGLQTAPTSRRCCRAGRAPSRRRPPGEWGSKTLSRGQRHGAP